MLGSLFEEMYSVLKENGRVEEEPLLTRLGELLYDIDHLPNVVVKMHCTSQVNTKAIVHIISAYSTESLFPIARRLVSDTSDYYIDGFFEFP